MNRQLSLGCFKDPKDIRDIPMGLVLPAVVVPVSFDFTKLMSPVRNQGREGTCVAFASVVGVKEFQDKKEYHKLVKLSPRFLYNLCKKFDGIPFEDGTYPRIAMKVLLHYGVCHESFWPYVAAKRTLPRAGADKDALKFKIKAYARIKSELEMKRSLLVNGPFIAGVEVFKSWFTKKVESSGLVPMPKLKEGSVGGHAICIVGYDEKMKIFKFKNSWGVGWGSAGYGYLPYAYMKKYCSDAWSATDLIENPKVLVKKLAKNREWC
ncbi:MAG: C1 family peptidase [Candidatus Omnitrophota bacterium]